MNDFARNFRRFTAVVLAAGLCAAAAQGQEAEPSSADTFNIPDNIVILGQSETSMRRPTATVNGTIITGTDVDQRVALLLAANEVTEVPEEELRRVRLQVLRNLIDETLQIQEAQAQEIGVTAEDVDRAYNRFAQQRGRSLDELEEYLRTIGSSPSSLKRQIEGELASSNLLRRNVIPFVNISAGEVNELYERLQASRGTEEYRIGEIFLSSTPTTREAVLQNALRIVEQLRQGGSFVGYARQFSEASTASVGGDLGWIRLEQLQNPQLEGAAREMQPGQLAGPIEIPGGFSILYLIDKRQVGMADPRDAILSLKQISLDFAPELGEEERRRQIAAFSQGVNAIRGCGEADSAAAALGASIVTNDQIQLRALPEALQNILLELNVGQATPPFGTVEEGVRVLILCGRDDPQVTAGPTLEELTNQLQDERVNRRYLRFMRDLRRDAVIEYN